LNLHIEKGYQCYSETTQPAKSRQVAPTSRRNLVTSDYCTVNVVKNDIVRVASQYDVIVNSTGRQILGGGACSQAILAAAGPAVADEIRQSFPGGMVSGGVLLKYIYNNI